MAGETGFLSNTDKKFLRGEKEYDSKQGRYARRQAIRERARAAFEDFALLYNELPVDERNKIFDPPDDEVREFSVSLRRTIAFIYRSMKGEADTPDVADRSFRENFDDILEAGIRRAEFDRHPATASTFVEYDPPRVTIHRQPPHVDIDRVVEELVKDGGRDLGTNELRAMLMWATQTTLESDPVNDPDGRPQFDLHNLAERVEARASGGERTRFDEE